jgi:Big-like domain-containing protein/lysyl oxidase
MSGMAASSRGVFSRAAARFALACAAVLVLCMALAGGAWAAEPELPNLVADPPSNVSLETSTTEGGLKEPGEAMLLLRFNGYIHNVGPGALDFRGSRKSSSEAMHAFQRVYYSDGSFKEEPSSAELVFATADGHDHFHLQHAAKYSLWNSSRTGEAAPAMKVGFCLEDSEHVEPAVGPKEAVYSEGTGRKFCRRGEPEALSLFEGISAGWRDLYESTLAFQWVDASSVLPGEYWLREDVNPAGVIKETGGANAPGYATGATIIPGFDALAQSGETRPGEPRTLTLTSKAWKDTATPRYTIVRQPSHGTLSAVSGNQVTYTPAAGYSGPDSFTFSAADPNSPFPRHPSTAPVAIQVGGSKTLLAGDTTSTYSEGDQTPAGHEEAFQFTARSWGTVEELWFRTNETANPGITGLSLGVFSDKAGTPGELLGTATASGEPETSTWIKVGGLATRVVAGTKYWLATLPLGGASNELHFNAAAAKLTGTGDVESGAGGLTKLTEESEWKAFNQGPVGFQARGTEAQATVAVSGAPSSMIVGTSVQLSALVTNDSPAVMWSASEGTVSASGLYTAPSSPPAGGAVTVTATSSRGAQGQTSIAILPVPPVEPHPAAVASSTAEVGTTNPGGGPSGGPPGASPTIPPAVYRPGAVLIGHNLILTTKVTRAGRVRLTAYLGHRRLGSCAVQTPADRGFTCRVRLGRGIRLDAPISVLASLRIGTTLLDILRPAAPVPKMKMPTAGPSHAHAAVAQFWCSPTMLESP